MRDDLLNDMQSAVDDCFLLPELPEGSQLIQLQADPQGQFVGWWLLPMGTA